MMGWFSPYADFVGHIGVACFIFAFFLLQKQRLSFDSMAYLVLNLAGSILVMFSLLVTWNTPAFVLEAFWAMISIYGIWRTLAHRR